MQLPSNKAGLVLLGLIVIVSGCADNSNSKDVTVSQTKGVAIEGFSASPSEIFEGQLTTLELQLKNQGGTEATDVVARLFNRDFTTSSDTWNIQGDENSADKLKRIYFGELPAPDPQTDSPAVSVPRTWNLEAPDLEVAQSVPYDFYTRVFYKYSTTASTDIQVMSNNRYNELGVSRSQPSLDNTGGPIQIDVKTRTPIVFTNSGQDTQPVPVRIVVTNSGSGTPFLQSAYTGEESYEVTDDKANKVKIEVQAAGSSVSFDSNQQTVQMVNGEGIKSFTMDVSRVSDQEIQQTVPITVTAKYGYYQETSTSITVNGRQGSTSDDGDEDTQDNTDDDSDDSSYSYSGPEGLREDAASYHGLDKDKANDQRTCEYLNEESSSLAQVDTNDDGEGDTKPFEAYCD